MRNYTNHKYKLPIIQETVAIKSKKEINYIQRAQKISEQVLKNTIAKLTTGISELALVSFIIQQFKQKRIKALAFEPIVAFGQSTADVHHQPSKVQLKVDDIVMLDFGCTINGYCSDMTRTFFFGNPTKRQRLVYQTVLNAQLLALIKLRNGVRQAGTIDRAVRRFLTKKFGVKSFPHGLGHGIGRAIHEWPSLKPHSADILKPHMVITVEPGLYFPGWGGVRIEDLVVIRKMGISHLTNFPKDLKSVILPLKS